MFANFIHIITSPLKAWKVTVVGLECDNAAFYGNFKKVHTRNCSFKKFFSSNFCKQGGKRIIVDILKHLY